MLFVILPDALVDVCRVFYQVPWQAEPQTRTPKRGEGERSQEGSVMAAPLSSFSRSIFILCVIHLVIVMYFTVCYYISLSLSIYIYIYIRIHICVYIYIYIYIYTHTISCVRLLLSYLLYCYVCPFCGRSCTSCIFVDRFSFCFIICLCLTSLALLSFSRSIVYF